MNSAAILKEYREDILKFAADQFQFYGDPWQEEMLKEFARSDKSVHRIAAVSCAGPGKSAVLAICAWWFLITQGRMGHHPKGAALSVTTDNLNQNLWSEISKWRMRSPLATNLFEMNTQKIFSKEYPTTWFIGARGYAKSADKETLGKTLSGLHAQFVLFLIDESGTIDPVVLKAAEQALGTEDLKFARIIQCGNPTSLSGMLYQAAIRETQRWKIINITGDPDDPMRSSRINKEWAQQQIDTYGRDDVWVKTTVLGQFPDSAVNSLLSVNDVEAAMKRHYRIEEYDHAEKRLGVDVAGTGLDLNIFFPRQGLVAFKYSVMRQGKPSDIAARIILAKERWNVSQIFVDSTGGWGSGAIDALGSAGHDCHGINFAEKSVSSRFYNRRAEMWWKMAEWVKRGGCLPDCDYLRRELTEVLYTTKDGKFLIEPKEQLIKRLGYSPDRADALALTFALPELPRSDTLFPMGQQERLTDYDPLAHVW